MCGRFSLIVAYDELKEILRKTFDLTTLPNELKLPKYNIAPSQQLLSVINDGQDYRVGLLKWGFIPPFIKNKEDIFTIINAREETIEEKPSFKDALNHQRCIIIATGFYEWKTKKDPYYITVNNQKIIFFAGLWNKQSFADESHSTTLIITTKSKDKMSSVHERMPVILDNSQIKTWLNPHINTVSELKELLSKPMSNFDVMPIKTTINNPKNNDESALQPRNN
ncbi:MAG: SOS response-associated peptidase [Candidatus Izimaplasma sp.]|nr:SOS response-associated peptidase [Candidatus Izimaplasma bacterium]